MSLDNVLLLFDLDGTLVDTAPDLVDSLNTVLAPRGLAEVSVDEMRPFIGHGSRWMIGRSLQAEGIEVSGAELSELHASYLAHYEARIADLSKPYPDLVAALDALEREGAFFAVCTNKYERLAAELLRSLGLASRFRCIAGPDTFAAKKPDPLHLIRTIEACGGRREKTLMVGDSRIDLQAARNANVPMIGVSFGYTDTPMAALGPDRLIDSFQELPAAAAALAGEAIPVFGGSSA